MLEKSLLYYYSLKFLDISVAENTEDPDQTAHRNGQSDP